MAIASLILSIIGFFVSITIFKFVSLILCIISIVLGIIAIIKKKNRVIAIIAVVIALSGFGLSINGKDNTATEKTSSAEVVESTIDNNNETMIETTTVEETEEPEAEYEIGTGTVTIINKGAGSNWIMVAVPVTNTGSVNLSLLSGSFDIEDSNGNLVDTFNIISSYPNIIKPGETGYFYNDTTYNGEETSELKVVPHLKIYKSNKECIRYDVSDIQIKYNSYSETAVIGRVENTTSNDDYDARVTAFLFDKNNNFLGLVSGRMYNGLPAGEKTAFDLGNHLNYFEPSDVASYTVYAYSEQ